MLDPEGLARRWVPGRGTPLVRLVARGPKAATYSVRRDGRRYALRLPLAPPGPPAAAAPSWEQRVSAAAGWAGLGPAVSQSDAATGIVVTEWARGRVWTRAQAAQRVGIARIAALVRAIQALSPPPPRYARQPAGWIRHYRRIGGGAGIVAPRQGARFAGEALRRLELLGRRPARAAVLCHSDLHRHNLVDGAAGLVVLDWEYAHYSDPYWDLAGWLSANDLGARHGRLLLADYLGRAPRPGQIERLTLLAWLYDYVCLLWTEAHHGQLGAPAGAGLARRAGKLAARLSASP